MYLVKKLREKININAYGIEQEIPLAWYKGMMGAVPVFNTMQKQRKTHEDRLRILFK